jgi:5-methylcytosine-specific restriction endonuclease McrA
MAKVSRYIDRTGQKFGRLTVVSYAGTVLRGKDKKSNATWLCKCDCGKEKTTSAHALAHGLTKSCGCLHIENAHKNVKKAGPAAWKAKSLPFGEAIRNEVIYSYKDHAKGRGHDWLLTDEIATLMIAGNCHYCGIEPSTIRSKIQHHRTNVFKYNGIDRMDNEKGYTADNVVTCCELCNYSKRSLTYKEFNDHLDRIGKFRASKLTNVVQIGEKEKIS